MTDAPLTSEEQFEPLRVGFTRAQLQERAKEFMHIHFGDIRHMGPEDKKAYHEIAGILMFYVDHLWKPYS